MNFAKKSAALAMSAVMLISSLAVGTTAFAATGKKSFTAMNGTTQSFAATVTDTPDSEGYHDYDVESTSYYTFTPAASGYYALSVSATPIYRNEVVKTDSWGDTYTTSEYSYTAGQNAKRVDYAGVSIYETYNADTDALTDYVGGTSNEREATAYTQKEAGAYPEASAWAEYSGYTTVKLTKGTTYYIAASSEDWWVSVPGTTTGERVILSGGSFSITPTDWAVSVCSKLAGTQEFTVNGGYYNEDDVYVNGTYTETRDIYSRYADVTYAGTAKDVVVPDVVTPNNYPVNTVSGSENKAITSLTLSNNVKRVYNFSDIKSLAAVNLASVETIGSYCFGNTGLTSVVIPATVKSVGGSAFSDCTSLSALTITNGVKAIGSYAFYNTALKSAVIPASVNSIGEYAFGYEENLNTATVAPYDTTATLVSGFIMGGYSNAEAQNYAALNGIAYYDMTAGCPHAYAYTTTAATIFAKGSKVGTCPLCGATTKKSIAKKTFKISSLKSSKKSTIVVKAPKQAGITGYKVEYSTSKKFTKKTTKTVTVKSKKALNKTIKGLKSGKKYYVRVRAYNTTGKKTVYSKYTAVKSVKVK